MPRINWNAITIGTQTKSIQQWCAEVGKVDVDTAKRRIYYSKWPPAQAIGKEPRVRDAENARKRTRDQTLAFEGYEFTLKKWSEIKQIAYRTLIDRYNRYGADRPQDILDQRRQTRTLVRQKRLVRTLEGLWQNPGPTPDERNLLKEMKTQEAALNPALAPADAPRKKGTLKPRANRAK